MKQIKLIFCVSCLAIGFVLSALSGCSNKLEVQQDVAWKKVCTKWGSPMAKVREMMRTYTLKSSSSTVLTYKGKYPVEALSYQFAEDSLCAVVVLMDAEVVEKADIRSSFSGYQALGENNSSELYIGYSDETLATITSHKIGEKEYFSVGYADLGNVIVPAK